MRSRGVSRTEKAVREIRQLTRKMNQLRENRELPFITTAVLGPLARTAAHLSTEANWYAMHWHGTDREAREEQREVALTAAARKKARLAGLKTHGGARRPLTRRRRRRNMPPGNPGKPRGTGA